MKTPLRADIITNLKARQAWYAAGCPMLEGVANDYVSSGDLAKDASADLQTALDLIPGPDQVVLACKDYNDLIAAIKSSIATVEGLDMREGLALLTRLGEMPKAPKREGPRG